MFRYHFTFPGQSDVYDSTGFPLHLGVVGNVQHRANQCIIQTMAKSPRPRHTYTRLGDIEQNAAIADLDIKWGCLFYQSNCSTQAVASATIKLCANKAAHLFALYP